jgi:hypothetical protein
METKKCSECKQDLPVEENFYLRKKSIPGWYQNKCKNCKKDTDGRYAKSRTRRLKRFFSGEILLSDAMNLLKIKGDIETTSVDTIKIAYKERALENHPDKGGSEEKMKLINIAYKMLIDYTS